MTEAEFLKAHPRLYHMATARALEQIERLGLLSSEATLNLLGIGGEQRQRLLAARRPQAVELDHPEHGKFVLRDQKPLQERALRKCLVDMEPGDFYRLLNERTFLWANKDRVERLLAARAYRSRDQLLLTIDTKTLMQHHADDIEVSSINAGAALYGNPPARGRDTFCRLADYEKFNAKRKIVEVTVRGSIPNLRDMIVNAEVRDAVK